MRIFTFVVLIASYCVVPAIADDSAFTLTTRNPDASIRYTRSLYTDPYTEHIFAEIRVGLLKQGARARTALLELDYWHEETRGFFGFSNPPRRKDIRTKDGKAAEVILMEAFAAHYPGYDFLLAFLIVDQQVVDWASCWSYNRDGSPELLLEDVDGDGIKDLAFRANGGNRAHSLAGDKRKWYYAYTITSTGLKNLFPKTDRDYQLKVSCEQSDQPVKLVVEGLPDRIGEYQMCDCIISATNVSKHEMNVGRHPLSLSVDKIGYWLSSTPPKIGSPMRPGATVNWSSQRSVSKTVLKPGETVSEAYRFFLTGEGDSRTLICKYLPNAPEIGKR
jgi:hypothetical protein